MDKCNIFFLLLVTTNNVFWFAIHKEMKSSRNNCHILSTLSTLQKLKLWFITLHIIFQQIVLISIFRHLNWIFIALRVICPDRIRDIPVIQIDLFSHKTKVGLDMFKYITKAPPLLYIQFLCYYLFTNEHMIVKLLMPGNLAYIT